MKKLGVWLLAAVIGFSAVPGAFAAGKGAYGDGALSENEIEHRIRFIQKRLDSYKVHGTIWYYTWLTINSSAAVGLSFAAANTGDKADRVKYASRATLATVGIGELLLRPLKARHGADPIRDMPDATRREKLAKLRAAENLLHQTAERAAERHSWFMHLGNVLANSAAGGATAIAGDSGGGALSAAVGTLMGEAFLWSQPAAPETDWKAYQEMVAGSKAERVGVSVRPLGMGLMVQVRW